MDHTESARVFKALGDEKRLRIIEMLSQGTMCACRILEKFDFTQPALSQHMKILTRCGLVKGTREGNWMHYSLEAGKYAETTAFLNNITGRDHDPSER